MGKIFGAITAALALIIQILTIRELVGRDQHVQALIASLQSVVAGVETAKSAPDSPSRTILIHGPNNKISLAYFRYSFRSREGDAWHAWLIMSSAMGLIVFIFLWAK